MNVAIHQWHIHKNVLKAWTYIRTEYWEQWRLRCYNSCCRNHAVTLSVCHCMRSGRWCSNLDDACIGRDVRGASRAALICLRRLTAGVPGLRCNFAPAPRAHRWKYFPGLFTQACLFTFPPQAAGCLSCCSSAQVVTPVSLCVFHFYRRHFISWELCRATWV